MPREADLFGQTSVSPLEAYLLLRRQDRIIPPTWIDRVSEARKSREEGLAKGLSENSLDALDLL